MTQSKILIILFSGLIVEILLKNLFFSLLFLFFILFILYRNYELTRKEFVCLRCGRCCKLKVEPSKEDIKRIEKAGYKNFLLKKKYLKKVKGYCMFLKLKKGMAICTINNIKPELCKKWPISKGIFGKQADLRCVKMFSRTK